MSNTRHNSHKELATREDEKMPEKDISSEALLVVGKIFEYAREAKITERELEKYRMKRDIAVKEIVEKYKFAHALMNKTFKERRMVIEKQFEAIDRGLEQNDYQQVNIGLHNITAIVKDNPFKIFQMTNPEQRRDMLETGNLPGQ